MDTGERGFLIAKWLEQRPEIKSRRCEADRSKLKNCEDRGINIGGR